MVYGSTFDYHHDTNVPSLVKTNLIERKENKMGGFEWNVNAFSDIILITGKDSLTYY